MRKLTKLIFTTIAASCYLFVSAQTQDAMTAYMTPGEMHQMMAKSAGTWSGAITMWMKPGAPPITGTGEAKQEMILGGRYLQSKNLGTMMGMPFEGMSTIAYDNAKKVFVNSWIDNGGTGITVLEGTWDASNKMINFTGNMFEPSAGKEIPIRETLKFVDDNTQIHEMFVMQNGKEFKMMEIKYTRK